MSEDSERCPKVVILAGPNGAGKTTASKYLLQGALEVSEFVNADVIARGLSAFNPESVAVWTNWPLLARTSRSRPLSRREAFDLEFKVY